MVLSAASAAWYSCGAELVIHVVQPGLGVFVYQPVEQVAALEVKLGWRRRWW